MNSALRKARDGYKKTNDLADARASYAALIKILYRLKGRRNVSMRQYDNSLDRLTDMWAEKNYI